MVQQDPESQFCTETVEDEVAFGPENFRYPPSKIRESVDRSLKGVGASHLVDRRLSTLSGGEKQKIAIASMLAVDPKILILDEPTSSLDPKSVRDVVAAIDTLRLDRKITTIVIEHRLGSFLQRAERIVMLDKGRLVTDCRRGEGTFAEISAMVRAPAPRRRFATSGRTVVSVRGLGYEVDGKRILSGVDLDVKERAVLGLMGENGSGKTTLLRHLTGLTGVQEWEVQILRHRLTRSNRVEPWVLGADIGLVFQNPNHQVFENTVRDEILFASVNFEKPTDSAKESIAEFERTEGVNAIVHPHCLSFGQKRRVNIKSASSHGPSILLMDEPFAGQDPRNSAAIAGLVAGLQESGKTIILVTHDPDFARSFCTDIAVMREGRICMSGRAMDVSEESWKALGEGGLP
jgi:energy-coupling factor transporter ATP-binding protein EcfA2